MKKLFKAFDAGKSSTLYTTLEPCIQCLGSCVTNNVSKIIYIQKDPNGGACDMKHDKIGLHYREVWPEIIHAPISEKPKKLMIAFLFIAWLTARRTSFLLNGGFSVFMAI